VCDINRCMEPIRFRKRVSWSLPEDLLNDLEMVRGEDVPMSRVAEKLLKTGLQHVKAES